MLDFCNYYISKVHSQRIVLIGTIEGRVEKYRKQEQSIHFGFAFEHDVTGQMSRQQETMQLV